MENSKTIEPKLEAYLVANPTGLAELSEAVETALASPIGRASIELTSPDGDNFILHIIRQISDEFDSEVADCEQKHQTA